MSRPIPKRPPDFGRTRILLRPGGFFWTAKDNGREYGPFATLLEAVRDMEAADASPIAPGETLEQAESEIGIAGFIDPETGEPVEEERPRLEQH